MNQAYKCFTEKVKEYINKGYIIRYVDCNRIIMQNCGQEEYTISIDTDLTNSGTLVKVVEKIGALSSSIIFSQRF